MKFKALFLSLTLFPILAFATMKQPPKPPPKAKPNEQRKLEAQKPQPQPQQQKPQIPVKN